MRLRKRRLLFAGWAIAAVLVLSGCPSGGATQDACAQPTAGQTAAASVTTRAEARSTGLDVYRSRNARSCRSPSDRAEKRTLFRACPETGLPGDGSPRQDRLHHLR